MTAEDAATELDSALWSLRDRLEDFGANLRATIATARAEGYAAGKADGRADLSEVTAQRDHAMRTIMAMLQVSGGRIEIPKAVMVALDFRSLAIEQSGDVATDSTVFRLAALAAPAGETKEAGDGE